MPDRSRRLRHSIAHFERLLRQTTDLEVIKIYRAEIAASKAMLEELERGEARLNRERSGTCLTHINQMRMTDRNARFRGKSSQERGAP